GIVQMRFPAASPEEMRMATVTFDTAGALRGYTEMRRTPAGEMTSIMIDVAAGTGGATNVTKEGALVTIGKGTADEALNNAALGPPSRVIEQMLARCGRPGGTTEQ
ncbi:MAG TPA: hypothetical protein VNP72_02650, partial [Longimicrobium sp.]|nr:hypothetical protein [Longimicrobium sp.]